MDLLWVIIAAIGGMVLSIVVTQLSGSQWNWKVFWAAFIPGAVNAAAWAIKQSLSADLTMDVIMAVIGGFGISGLIAHTVAMRIINNQVKAMQTKDNK